MHDYTDFDSPWKTVLEQFFPECIQFFFPDLYEAIDWTEPVVFLDKEFQKIVGESEIGSKRVDKLVDVKLKSGESLWLLIHIEIQGQRDTLFTKRMFIYHYRIFDVHDRHPVSVAILTDEHEGWRPRQYTVNQYNFGLQVDFPIIKLLDYDSEQLEQSDNPFAFVTLAHLETMAVGKQGDLAKMATKKRLFIHLLKRGYTKDDIRKLMIFIDWILRLPPELEQRLQLDVVEQSELNMEYIPTWERKAHSEGVEQGVRRTILKIIDRRLDEHPDEQFVKNLDLLNVDRLENFVDFVLVARTFDDAHEHLLDLLEEMEDEEMDEEDAQ